MRKTLTIARLELSILFYSPVAWLVLIIFIVQSGTRFLGMFGGYREAIAMGNNVNDLTFALFPGTGGLFEQTLQHIYLYIPLLTMGLMSRETSSGSIKLLLSSPVKIKEIITGKYLAITTYGFLLILVLGAYAIAGMMVIKNADAGLIISGLTGLFLLTCTYAAIGLFMSSLTPYQVVAAISTLAVFAGLQYVGTIGQEMAFIRDITYFLSIAGRTDDLLKGLLNSRDVLYFLIIIALFLSLCILRLEAARSAKRWTQQIPRYAVVVTAALLLVYFSSRPRFIIYKDLTANKSQSLTPNSQLVARKIDGPLTITTYVNLLDQNVYTGLPASRNLDLSRFDQYRRYIPGLEMKYVYYYDITDLKNNRNMIYQGDLTGLSMKQIAEKVADNMGVDMGDFMSPAEIRKLINLQTEDNNLVRILEYKGKKSTLRLYDEIDAFPSEAEVTAAIKQLLVPASKIAFVTGHNERSSSKTGERNYQLITNAKKTRKSLINQGFEVADVDLSSPDKLKDVAVLLLADPAEHLSNAELDILKKYIDSGGNVMVTTEPGHQSVINPVLELFGMRLKEGTLVMPSKDNAPTQLTMNNPKEGMPVAMSGASALIYRFEGGFKADTLLLSPPTGWNKYGNIDAAASELSFDPSSGDTKGSYPAAVILSRSIKGKWQKIFIAGDADFMSNAELSKAMNSRFATEIFKWLSNGEFPVDTSRPASKDDDIQLKKKEISNLKMIFLGLAPILVALFGAYILISRKRK
ncbi:Gldg family protein [Pedobacter psychroterrae]|uniref:ABC transporter permease n=1 Tax=Pedobacter psychroterrae TaxID=2530453 RepID=A0A4R0NV74_9SPHI|nr:Gldg family protein [Pedobacter psychroterrae]TCD03943.1 ABC transporter permease [Pedobacter psychroterrae]